MIRRYELDSQIRSCEVSIGYYLCLEIIETKRVVKLGSRLYFTQAQKNPKYNSGPGQPALRRGAKELLELLLRI